MTSSTAPPASSRAPAPPPQQQQQPPPTTTTSSSTNGPQIYTGAGAGTGSGMAAGERSYFETQRAALIGEIAISMEHVLSNINKLNRSLEGVIAVGNEFGSVEALWSQFEGVMARDAGVGVVGGQQQQQQQVATGAVAGVGGEGDAGGCGDNVGAAAGTMGGSEKGYGRRGRGDDEDED